MFYLVFSIIQSVLILVAFKLFKRLGIDNWQAITVNYIVATSFGFITYQGTWTIHNLPQMPWFTGALILGILFISTFYLYALSSQKAGVALTSVAANMSVVIPVIFGLILFQESASILKISGVVLALTAFYLTFKKEGRMKIEWSYLLLPLLMFLGTGINNTLMKYIEFHYIDDDITLFLAVVFCVSLSIGIIKFARDLFSGKQKIALRHIIAGTILGLLNFGSTYYIIKAMGIYESSVVFPIQNSSIVGLSAIVGFLIFGEPLSRINWMGIALAIVSIIMITYA